MSSEVEGTVAQVVADFGDKVTAGQVMMKINPREYELRVETAQAALDQERAKLANSTARYNRAQALKRAADHLGRAVRSNGVAAARRSG